MQVLLLGLFVALFLHDATTFVEVTSPDGVVRAVEAMPGDIWPGLGPFTVALIVLVPKLLIALLYHRACRRTLRRLGTDRGQKALNRLEAITSAMPLLLLSLFITDLAAGGLRTIRISLSHIVLVDEVLMMLPTLLVAIVGWWSYYPVDRRLREAVILREVDSGKPVYPILSRGQFVSMQLRHQFGLLLLPLLAVFGWAETLALLGPDHDGPLTENTALSLTPVGVVAVFILAPLVIRHIWHTTPLAQGELRDRMLALCAQHRVRVRELLLWRTGGRLINAAVTGLFSKVRYILLSDALLDQVSAREVEAVMAHEIAHVKCRHIIWMGLVLVATLGTLEQAGHLALDAAFGPTPQAKASVAGFDAEPPAIDDPQVRMLIVSGPAFLITLFIFGWISRRIERQADVFAVRHLACSTETLQYDQWGRHVFDLQSIETMVQALQRVAELNHAPVHRKSWRHGSIAWRQAHLRSLVATPTGEARIDRVLARVKLATLAGLLLLALLATNWGSDLPALFAG